MIIVNDYDADDADDVDKHDDVREKFPVDELGMMILASFFSFLLLHEQQQP